ncbi:MAG: flagellar biosynthetic protein FliO [Actinomycetota bacterium]|nr:flagellar biosynthetic protein FliO [Actinomycetota bacterium]
MLREYEDPAGAAKEPSLFAEIISLILTALRYLLSLAFVLALGYLMVKGLKIFLGRGAPFASEGNDLIKIAEIKYLAPNKSLMLVEAGGKTVLLGVGASDIALLFEIDDENEVAKIRSKKAASPAASFQGQLFGFAKKMGGGDKGSFEIRKSVKEAAASISKRVDEFTRDGGDKR